MNTVTFSEHIAGNEQAKINALLHVGIHTISMQRVEGIHCGQAFRLDPNEETAVCEHVEDPFCVSHVSSHL